MSSFCKCKIYSHFFSKNISIYAIFNDQSFNNMLTNNTVSFEQLGPDKYFFLFLYKSICCGYSYKMPRKHVVGTLLNHLSKAFQSNHNIHLCGEIRKKSILFG